jgi:hypothetical protein
MRGRRVWPCPALLFTSVFDLLSPIKRMMLPATPSHGSEGQDREAIIPSNITSRSSSIIYITYPAQEDSGNGLTL